MTKAKNSLNLEFKELIRRINSEHNLLLRDKDGTKNYETSIDRSSISAWAGGKTFQLAA